MDAGLWDYLVAIGTAWWVVFFGVEGVVALVERRRKQEFPFKFMVGLAVCFLAVAPYFAWREARLHGAEASSYEQLSLCHSLQSRLFKGERILLAARDLDGSDRPIVAQRAWGSWWSDVYDLLAYTSPSWVREFTELHPRMEFGTWDGHGKPEYLEMELELLNSYVDRLRCR